MKIKCVIIDDEPLAVSVIESHVRQTPFLELSAKFIHPLKAFEFLSENEVDLLFIDIQMPDLSGLDLVKGLSKPPAVILTTAFDQYAIEGFRVDAIDYLLKPIDYPEFLKAVTKAGEWISAKRASGHDFQTNKEFLFIKSEYKIVRINFNEIQYIQGMSEYVKIYLTQGKPILSLLSLKSLEAELPESRFMRVHKSYIVNLEKISVIERNEIVYDNGTVIPVSPQYKAKFQEFIDKNFMV
jgi:two-component system LytT family response regulator